MWKNNNFKRGLFQFYNSNPSFTLKINGTDIPIYKSGSKIHIKKKNRGKFTDYCGGKVTDACIRRAKASGNPTLVKRATFAANVRKWKHQKGGLLTSTYEYKKPTYQTQFKKPLVEDNDSSYLDFLQDFLTTPSDVKVSSDEIVLPNLHFPGSVVMPVSDSKSSNPGDLNKTLDQILTEEGIPHRVTSSYRPHAQTSTGKPSNHSKKDSAGNSMALDIVPTDGNFDKFREQIYGNKRVMNWLRSKNWGILEEIDPRGGYINQRGEFRKTNATGPHFHFGPDGFLKA